MILSFDSGPFDFVIPNISYAQHSTDGSDVCADQQNGITYSKSVVSGETRLLVKQGETTVQNSESANDSKWRRSA